MGSDLNNERRPAKHAVKRYWKTNEEKKGPRAWYGRNRKADTAQVLTVATMLPRIASVIVMTVCVTPRT